VSSVRTILAGLFTALGGFFLLALTAGAGFAIYLATAPDIAIPPADADAVSSRPFMRAETTSPLRQKVAWTGSTALAAPLNAPAPVHDVRSRVRQLQKALARAECYSGPVNGIWSDASKDAMRGFVQTVNAALPVDNPDDALIALIESNETAKCAFGRTISTGTLALGNPLQAAAHSQDTPARVTAANPPARDEPAMLERPWVPAGMLAPSYTPATEERVAIASTTAVATISAPAPQAVTTTDPAPSEPQLSSSSASSAHFEDNKPLPAAQPSDPAPGSSSQTASSPTASDPSAADAAKLKKAKSAKRRRKDDDVETTISKSFDSLQRSIASMF
jgi:hypothetical protein